MAEVQWIRLIVGMFDGKHYKNKTHFQAFIEMAEKDRRIK